MNTQEPRNGDFVAYIEQLQRESAARLAASGRTSLADLPPAAPTSPASTTAASRDPARPTSRSTTAARPTAPPDVQGPVLNRQQAEQLLERLKARKSDVATQRAPRPAAGPVIALIVGALLTVQALASNGGIFALAIGIALMIWGFRRLHLRGTSGAAERRRRHKEYQQRVTEAFGRSPDSTGSPGSRGP